MPRRDDLYLADILEAAHCVLPSQPGAGWPTFPSPPVSDH